MTPHKAKGGKSYRIDRVFAGVGRIAISSGTDHLGTFRRINAALTGIAKIGRIDVLAGIRDGTWAPLVVLHHYERGQLDRLPTAETTARLVDALWAFQKNHQCSAKHRSAIGTSVRHVERATGAKRATVLELPKILRGMKPGFADRPVAFNRLRAHLLAFANETHGKYSPLWTEVSRVNRYKKAEGVRPKKMQRRPLTVAELEAVFAAFKDHPVYGGKRGGGRSLRRTITAADLRRMTSTLAMTGMRPAEYWQRGGATWEARALPLHIMVYGTKTAAARRPTLLIGGTIAGPSCGEQFFRQAFAAATEQSLRVALDTYSLRRTFASWCESAGLVESRRQAYLGHGPKTVTDIYLQTNVVPFVEEDADRVAGWLADELERASRRAHLTLAGRES